ncbi:SDR family NAD(P)-dependent oxidoreductase [Shewanella inventionis]|uniref:Short-chain dehydrogenase n=1 Tax=Shewanella inventionis TaxID=1738770 RepID=A0ABQ1ITY5_9GAMM|nr:SDR family NAD(P)-dependent oxidoreductase [Shewanella inventionis]MCL1156851.1 SDR family NAD(P)-dependent oxidoreductase [Shewanella inventionis]UAL45217.1 SDR family NAD(P)-dependent oxidoreductase [Shewanella inventionis]GGB51231.1 short-chain dehydrogenase [Shewanella inventionis]
MIVITGASSGLGAALTQHYAADDCQLLISGRSKQKLAAVTATLTPAQQDKVVSQVADLSVADDVSRLFSQLSTPPTTVIHCAGSGYFGPIEQQNPQAIDQLISNNLTSSILVLRELVSRYRDHKVNVVVVMSTAALAGKANESTYCAVKWAVKGLVESLRLELKGCPMKLIAVYPGGMATDFWSTSGKDIDTSSFMTADEAALMLKNALVATQHGYISDLTINRG